MEHGRNHLLFINPSTSEQSLYTINYHIIFIIKTHPDLLSFNIKQPCPNPQTPKPNSKQRPQKPSTNTKTVMTFHLLILSDRLRTLLGISIMIGNIWNLFNRPGTKVGSISMIVLIKMKNSKVGSIWLILVSSRKILIIGNGSKISIIR